MCYLYKIFQAGIAPCPLFLLLILHVVKDPVPHNEDPGNDHIGEQSCAEE